MDHNVISSRLANCFVAEQFIQEDQRLQYLFFVANVASESKIRQEPTFYYKVVLDITRNLDEYIEFNKSLLKRSMSKKRLMR